MGRNASPGRGPVEPVAAGQDVADHGLAGDLRKVLVDQQPLVVPERYLAGDQVPQVGVGQVGAAGGGEAAQAEAGPGRRGPGCRTGCARRAARRSSRSRRCAGRRAARSRCRPRWGPWARPRARRRFRSSARARPSRPGSARTGRGAWRGRRRTPSPGPVRACGCSARPAGSAAPPAVTSDQR